MAEINKFQDEKKPNLPLIPVDSTAMQPGENPYAYSARIHHADVAPGRFNLEYGTQEQNLKDMNDFSGRIPGLIQETQLMSPKQSNAYGGDQHLYDAIDRRAQDNYNENMKGFESQLKQKDFEYRQNRLDQEYQKTGAIRQFEQAKQTLRDFQRAEKKRKRGAVVGNILGVVGAVVGGIFGGPAGASAGMQGGKAVGNLAGGA